MDKKFTILVSIFLVALIITGCNTLELRDSDELPDDSQSTSSGDEPTQELKKFSSKAELMDFLKDAESGSSYDLGSFSRGLGGVMMAETDMAMEATASTPKSGSTQTASEHSETNVQVKGVDEADFIKNDNKYIYLISQDKLVIVDAYPADSAKILSETEIEGTPRELFVNGDRLVVFTQTHENVFVFPEYGYTPVKQYTQQTRALVYDVSDRKAPELIRNYNIKGNYFQSRMIDDDVYFIVKDSVYYNRYYVDTPVIREGNSKVITPEIFYFDNPESNYVFHTIASLDIDSDKSDINAKTFLMGYSNNLYVSMNNIYITYQKNMPYSHYNQNSAERFYDVVVPLLPLDTQDKINVIKDDDSLDSYEAWDKISVVMEDMYNNMEEKDKDDLIDEIEETIEEYEVRKEQERRKTIIHKIAIDNGKIEYKTRGEVNGYLLNQFSMDEYKGNLRVATTSYLYTRHKSTMFNNVYVLDEDLEQVGEIEEIAEGEKIYSARFIGDRLYMVTFQRIDPFFVIDLSNAKNPKILGELKIPGFSDYLHPYDENHIIGIGKETTENQWGGVSIKGIKLALFNVEDVKNPVQVDMIEIGTSGSDSEALREHKAFLFDKEKNLLVIPVREVKGPKYYDKAYHYYRREIWQGAYVLHLDKDGFEVQGKISHYEGDEDDRYYWGSPYAVRRSLYMDNTLYTVSSEIIKANDLSDDLEEISEVNLPYKQQGYYPYYW